MPLYSFKCSMCSTRQQFMVPIADRNLPQECEFCDQKVMVREFEPTSSTGFKFFTPFHNTSLDCDIETQAEQDEIYRDMGVIEAGDKVRGGRNFDEKANNIEPERLNGKKYVPQAVKKKRKAKQREALRQAAGLQAQATDGTWKDI